MLQLRQFSGMNCHYIRYSMDYFLDSMAELGYERIEIWAASPHYFAPDFDDKKTKNLKNMLDSRNLKLACLTPEQVTYPVNIASREEDVRKRSIELHKKTLEHAALLESPLMLLTPGCGYYDELREDAWKRSADSIAQIVRHAETVGVTIALEHLSPASSNLINSAADLQRMLQDVNLPRLKAMFDVGQVNILGEDVPTYFDLLGDDIVHIHFVDGTPGGHLALGDGDIDLQAALDAIANTGYTGHISLEIADRRYFSNPQLADEQSLKWLHKRTAH